MKMFLLWIVSITILIVSCSDNLSEKAGYQFYMFQGKKSDLVKSNDSIYSIIDNSIRYNNAAYLFAEAGNVKVGNVVLLQWKMDKRYKKIV